MLSERTSKRTDFPKSWTAEIAKMERDSDEKDGKIAEYLETIDALARIVEEYESEKRATDRLMKYFLTQEV